MSGDQSLEEDAEDVVMGKIMPVATTCVALEIMVLSYCTLRILLAKQPNLFMLDVLQIFYMTD